MINDKPLNILASEFPELYNWVKSISRYDKIDDFIMIDYKESRMRVKFFTKNHEYRISAKRPEVNVHMDKGYLGCVVQVRKPRAGENWQRGNDLPDGKYCEETWLKIMRGIIAYELVKYIKPKKPMEDKNCIPCPKNFKPMTNGNGII